MTHVQPNEQRPDFQSNLWSEEVLGSFAIWQQVLELLSEQGFDGMAQAMTILINEAMKLERSAVLGARPFERTLPRRGQANGFKSKTLNTRVGQLELRMPQTRDVPFYPSALENGQRSERALKLAIAVMYVQGVTTRKVTAVIQELCGLDVTSSQVSRATQSSRNGVSGRWAKFPRYEHVRVNGIVLTCALLVAIGVLPNGKRKVLGLSVSLSEAEVHWRDFLATLQARGLHSVHLCMSDNYAGIKAALASRCGGVKWQRCQFHLG